MWAVSGQPKSLLQTELCSVQHHTKLFTFDRFLAIPWE